MTNKAVTKVPSVAPQQRSGAIRGYAELTNNQLHKAMLEVRDEFFNRCVKTQAYGLDTVLSACEEIIARFKLPGVGEKNRPGGKPTVEAYFRSIHLNYSTVRGWIRKKRLSTEMFAPKKTKSKNPDG